MRSVAMALPLLGWLGVLLLIRWKLGPWLPVGLTAAAAILLALSRLLARPPRQIEGDPAAVRRWRDNRVDKVGQRLGALTGVWLASSAALLIVMVVAALLVR